MRKLLVFSFSFLSITLFAQPKPGNRSSVDSSFIKKRDSLHKEILKRETAYYDVINKIQQDIKDSEFNRNMNNLQAFLKTQDEIKEKEAAQTTRRVSIFITVFIVVVLISLGFRNWRRSHEK